MTDDVSVLLNPGDGTFATHVIYDGGVNPISVKVTDLDGDGASDLAIVNCSDEGSVSVLLNQGSGAFAPPMSYGVGAEPQSVVAADLDGDGDTDLAVANNLSDSVSILFNQRGEGGGPLQVIGLEVTQGIQDWENSVVLIKDRPTFVRAHVRSTSGTVNDVTAELIGRRNGSELLDSPLRPANTGSNVDVLENSNRSQLNDSFYFELPESWRNGTVEFEFRGDSHTIACREHAGTDNDCKVRVTFTESLAADVRLVGVVWEENGTKHQPTWADIHEVVQQIESTFPIPQLDWDRPYDYKMAPLFFSGPPLTYTHFNKINTMLKLNRLLDGCISSWPVNCKPYYLGVIIDPPAHRDLNGMAAGIPADVASAYVLGGFTHPHELGHAAGRYHTDYNAQRGIDPPEGGPQYHEPTDGTISQEKSGNNQ